MGGGITARILIVLAAIAFGACSVRIDGASKYGTDDCTRIALRVEGRPAEKILGAEDLAIDRETGTLFISAYDRRTVEKAMRHRRQAPAEGNIYAVKLNDIQAAADGVVQVRPVIDAGSIAGGVRPHGIAFDENKRELVFVNRSIQRIDGKWRMTPHIEHVGLDGETSNTAQRRAPCTANNLIPIGDKLFVSFDHAACGWRAGLEDVLGLKRSGVVDAQGVLLNATLSYANGVTATMTGELAVGATREKAVVLFQHEGDSLLLQKRISIPGGPDNLTIADDGTIIAAAHPSLLRLAAHRRLGLGTAPSRIVKLDPDDGSVEVLFDDAGGKVFSAATAAIESQGGLVIGSVTDEGLLACRNRT